MVSIQLGEYYTTEDDIIIHTVLGSCISVCLFVPGINLTGINHFMLPSNPMNTESLKPGQYGINSMELLFAEFVKKGIAIKSLNAKIFGGSNITRTVNDDNIGSNNIRFIIDFLKTENIPIVEKNVGGFLGRKLLYFSRSHEVKIGFTRNTFRIKSEENKYQKDLRGKLDAGPDITMFK